MRVSEEEMTKAFGPSAKAAAPTTAVESVMAGIQELDKRIEEMVEKRRQPGDSHAVAYTKFMDENPAVFARYEEERARIVKGGNIGSDE